MKIKELEIKSFRGIKNVKFNLSDKLNVFGGKNGIGKSTIIDSIMWVLCDETLVYGKQSDDNRNMNDLKEVVNVVLTLENDIVLERKYYDVWKEDKDGQIKYSRTENQFFINGAKYKKEEFYNFIYDNIINLDRNFNLPKEYNLLRGLMDYNYFSSVDYKITRKFVEQLLSLKSDIEILNEEKYLPIKVDMQVQKFDISKCLSKYETSYKLLTKEIESKSAILQDQQNQYDESYIVEYNKLVEERNKLFNDNLQNKEEYLTLNRLLEQNRVNIQEEEKEIYEQIIAIEKNIGDLLFKGNQCDNQISLVHVERERLKRTVQDFENKIQSSQRNVQKLSEELKNEYNCPYCGKALDGEKLEETKRKINYQIQQENEQQEIYRKHIRVKIEEIQANENKEKSLNDEKAQYGKEYWAKQNELQMLKDKKAGNVKVNELLSESENLNQKLEQFVNNYNTERATKLNELTSKINQLQVFSYIPQTIEKLQKELKQLKVERAETENKKDLVKDFKELKLQMIKSNTSKVFPQLEIEILEENENTGNFKEVCYAKLKNVEYKGVNDGHRKLVGIMLIEDIKRALNINGLPIIFDKFADVDNEMINKIKSITNEQILTTIVNSENEIKLY